MSKQTQKGHKRIDQQSKLDWDILNKHISLYKKWLELLEQPTPGIASKVANLLAILELSPIIDEFGILEIRGTKEIPRLVGNMNPVVILSKIGELNPGEFTRAEQADTLKAATLVWAKAIPNEKTAILEVCPKADTSFIHTILALCDFKAFHKRRGVGKTAKNIREEFEQNSFQLTEQNFKDKLRNYKGGT